MSTGEQNLTLRRPSLAARATELQCDERELATVEARRPRSRPAVREHRTQRVRVKSALVRRGVPIEIAQKLSPGIVDAIPSQREAREIAAAPELHTARMSRPTWMAVAVTLTAVAFAVWWMTSRLPPRINPRSVIETNLAAETDGDIGRIADRYIQDAHTLLRTGRLAEAGLALERARRVRPDHSSLPTLEKELREQFNGILAKARESEIRAEALRLRDSPARPVPASMAPEKPTTPVAQESKPDITAIQPSVRAEPFLPVVALNQPHAAHKLIGEAQTTLDMSLLTNAQPAPERRDLSVNAAPPIAAEPVQPRLVKFVRPEYPNEAALRGFEGWVDVGLNVTAAGDVVNPRIEGSSSGRLFHRAALVAVRQWKYEPRAASEPTQYVQVRLEFKHSD